MARSFPGTAGNYLNIGDVAAIDITGTALTVAAWVKPDAGALTPAACGIVGKDIGSAVTGVQYYLHLVTGKPSFQIGDGAGSEGISSAVGDKLVADTWAHVAGRKNGTGAGALAVFKNGASVGSATSNKSIQNTAQPLRLGTRSSNDTPWKGLMGEVAIWNVALSDAEILALSKGVSPLTIRRDHLKGYWPLFGTAYPEVDLSSNGNHATQLGTVGVGDHAPVGRLAPFAG